VARQTLISKRRVASWGEERNRNNRLLRNLCFK
jgi:hypothetical protein